jgi:hypothetical protein
VKRVAFFMFLVASSATWPISASAQSTGVAEYARKSREMDKKAARQQQRLLKKAAKQQRKGMKKYAKEQRKAAKQANRSAR